jgi:alpha-N-arabinofuranosidase
MQAGQYAFEGDTIPAVSASASKDAQGRIHVTMSNLDPNRAHTVETSVRGQAVSGVTGRILTAPAMSAHNTFEQPEAVKPAPFTGARVANGTLTVQLPPKSVVVLELR